MNGTGCSTFLAAADVQPPSCRPRAKQTSPLKTRVRGFRQLPSGRYSSRHRRTLGIATSSERCAYGIVSGRRQWPNRDPLGEGGFAELNGIPLDEITRVTMEGPNQYSMVVNNPVNANDSNGLWNKLDCEALDRKIAKLYELAETEAWNPKYEHELERLIGLRERFCKPPPPPEPPPAPVPILLPPYRPPFQQNCTLPPFGFGPPRPFGGGLFVNPGLVTGTYLAGGVVVVGGVVIITRGRVR